MWCCVHFHIRMEKTLHNGPGQYTGGRVNAVQHMFGPIHTHLHNAYRQLLAKGIVTIRSLRSDVLITTCN